MEQSDHNFMSLINGVNFWCDKRVFVTGHTGFKGSWISLWLKEYGATIGGFSLSPPTDPNLYNAAGVCALYDQEWIEDIRNLDAFKNALKSFNPDILFHMAAQPIVRHSYLEPVDTYTTNVIGTVNVLEASRYIENLKAIVVITSDKCYENVEKMLPYTEADRMGGRDPYSSSKGCAELVAASYARSFFSESRCSVATARAGNVIGGGDWAKDRLLVDLIRSLTQRKHILLRNPDAIRPWQHVLDPIKGYLLLAEYIYSKSPIDFEGWNFGPKHDKVMCVRDIVDIAINIWGGGLVIEQSNVELHEAGILLLNSDKARSRLGWKSILDVEESVELTIKWFKCYNQNMNMRKYCIEQIANYEKKFIS